METYRGGCQCGRVAFEVAMTLAKPVVCNCSRCQRLGSVLAFVPAENFTLLRGEEALTEYLFASRTISHLFCATCGIESFARGSMPDGTPMVAVNVNCLEGIDPRALEYEFYDGRAV